MSDYSGIISIADEIQKRLNNLGLKNIDVETSDYFDKLYVYKVTEKKVWKRGKLKTKIKRIPIYVDRDFGVVYRDITRNVLNTKLIEDMLNWYSKALYNTIVDNGGPWVLK